MTTIAYPTHNIGREIAHLVILLLILSALPSSASAQLLPQPNRTATVETNTTGPAVKIAPGEILPISIKISNFGGGKRVDVLIRYQIIGSNGQDIYTSNETVAIETTNALIKTIQIPPGTAAGQYTAKSTIFYQGQVAPATTQFSFRVEPKIFGLFKSLFFIYSGVAILIGFFLIFLIYALANRRTRSRYGPIDYSNVPAAQRVFYELISDTIMGMRHQAGDKAMVIAQTIDGLTIDAKTGRVLRFNGSPSKVVAELVVGYEKMLGKKVSFAFRGAKER